MESISLVLTAIPTVPVGLVLSSGQPGPISLVLSVMGSPGLSSANPLIENEVPAGLLNGSNATFTTAFAFIPVSEEVYVNGVRQKLGLDYNTTGTTTIILNFSPASTEYISVDYTKQ